MSEESVRSERRGRDQSLTGTPMKGVLDPDSDDETQLLQEVREMHETPHKEKLPSHVL